MSVHTTILTSVFVKEAKISWTGHNGTMDLETSGDIISSHVVELEALDESSRMKIQSCVTSPELKLSSTSKAYILAFFIRRVFTTCKHSL